MQNIWESVVADVSILISDFLEIGQWAQNWWGEEGRADQELAVGTTVNPSFLGISDNSSWQRTKMGVGSADYCGTKGDGKGLFKSAAKFDLTWPQGLYVKANCGQSHYRQAHSKLCPLGLLLVVRLRSLGSAFILRNQTERFAVSWVIRVLRCLGDTEQWFTRGNHFALFCEVHHTSPFGFR